MKQKWRLNRVVPLTVLTLLTIFGASGFTLRPDVGTSDQKKVPNPNNAGLNSAQVTPTAFVAVPRLSLQLVHDVPKIHYAVILRRHNTLFVAIDTGDKDDLSRIEQQASASLKRHVSKKTVVYISSDETLVNHFHRYAADRAAHLPVSSGVIVADIERVFPGAK